MSLWKTDPIKIPQGYAQTYSYIYSLEYCTTSDILTIFQNGEPWLELEDWNAIGIGKLMTRWYLQYHLDLPKSVLEEIKKAEEIWEKK